MSKSQGRGPGGSSQTAGSVVAPRQAPLPVRKIVSGGQTGVDRGALDAAMALGLEHGGWCPRGRRSEDGRIPEQYGLTETAAAEYAVRTERNVIDSDGTLILARGRLTGGTRLTRQIAQRLKKPCLVVDLERTIDGASVREWLVDGQIETLNVAGPRESTAPGIAAQAKQFLLELFAGPAR